MEVENNNSDIEQSNNALSYLIAGLVAFAEGNWTYPYPSTLIRARGMFYGECIEQGKWGFQSMSEFIQLLQTPVRDWWPFRTTPEGIDPEIPLIDTQLQVSSQVEELLLDQDDMSGNQKFDAKELKLVLDNRKIREAVQKVQRHPELEDVYISLRRFLIENPWLNVSDGIDIPRDTVQLMGNVSDFYEKPSVNMIHDGKYWLCPRCNGILIWANHKPRCATRGLCDQIVNLTNSKSITGEIKTLKITFRKRVQLPGMPELELYKELSQIAGVKVNLWPEADRYDLFVEKNEVSKWALDIKDYTSEFTLSSLFHHTNPPYIKGAKFYYVIPDYRERLTPGYVQNLRRLSPKVAIRTISQLIQEVKKP